MKLLSAYRGLLKQIKRVCDTRPHFAQDLRVLVLNDIVQSNTSPSISTRNHRLPSNCFWIDSDALFLACKNDLRAAIERDLNGLSGDRLPLIVSQIQYQNELNWLRDRLNKALSDATGESIRQLVKIAQGPTEKDFIPDSFFRETSSSSSSGADKEDRSGKAEKHPLLHPAGTAVLPEGDDVLYSSGVIGCQRELVVLSREDKGFPLVHSFIGRSIVGPEMFDERYTQPHCISRLIQSVKDTLSSSCEKTTESVVVTLQLAPFDASYVDKSEAGYGPFHSAHRLFYASVALLSRNGKAVEIVNAHFFIMNILTKELSEKIGYIDPTAVFRLIREHIKEGGTSSFPTSDIKNKKENSFMGSGKGDPSDRFEVLLNSSSDGPVIVKGILYFKEAEIGKAFEECPIRAATFGPALFEV